MVEPGVVLGHRRLAILDLAPAPISRCVRRRALLDRLQRRDLQLLGTAQRAGTPGRPIPNYVRHRGAAGALREGRTGNAAASSWHVRVRHLGHPRTDCFWLAIRTGSSPSTTRRPRDGLSSRRRSRHCSHRGWFDCTRSRPGWPGSICGAASRSLDAVPRCASRCRRDTGCAYRDGMAGTPVCWHDIRDALAGRRADDATRRARARVRDALTDSVRAHLVSDVPVSVFLSGGIDSTVVAALAASCGAQSRASLSALRSSPGRPEDEVPAAAATAAHLGLPSHRTSRLPRRSSRRIPRAFWPRWISRRSTASTHGLRAKPRRSRATRSSSPGSAATSCSAATRRLHAFRERRRSPHRRSDVVRTRALLGGACRISRRQLPTPKMAGHADHRGLSRRRVFSPSRLVPSTGAAGADGPERRPVKDSRAWAARHPGLTAADARDHIGSRRPRSSPRAICGTSCCATATGQAWITRWNCGPRWSMSRCSRPWGLWFQLSHGGVGKALLSQSPRRNCPTRL